MSEKLKRSIDNTRDLNLKEMVSINTLLYRGVSEINPDAESLRNAAERDKLKVYLGIDPTSPELHIGHSVPLRKIGQFQELGHEVKLLFGTFTGMIGDPTDKSSTRVLLSEEQVVKNIRTYIEQAGKIINLSEDAKNPIAIVHNHEWLGKLGFAEIVDLASNFSVQQLEKRSMFKTRRDQEKPIWLHEFLYPLMQAYDAVAMDIDVEVGGSDQIFNMMIGRDLVKRYLNKEKWCVAGHLVVGTDGSKMGKSANNFINIQDLPESKFETVMSWSDKSMPLNLELLTRVPAEVITQFKHALENGSIHPMELKQALAFRIVAELDGVEEAKFAEEEFDRVLRKKQTVRRPMEIIVQAENTLPEILVIGGLASDQKEAYHLLTSGVVRINGRVVQKRTTRISESGSIVQLGKSTIRNVRKIIIN
ncbi:MAG: tyrosine--tRNA ligase [Patescibacteria group bacterium]|jgi:tyrosyl-tRNA synthetase